MFERDEEFRTTFAHSNIIDINNVSDNSMGLDKRIDRILKAIHPSRLRSHKSGTSSKMVEKPRSSKEPSEYRKRIEKKYEAYIENRKDTAINFKMSKEERAIELKPIKSSVVNIKKDKPEPKVTFTDKKSSQKDESGV